MLTSLLCVLAAALAAELQPPSAPTPQRGVRVDGDGYRMLMDTGKGSLEWRPGDPYVRILDRSGDEKHRIPLARPDKRYKDDVSFRALLPPKGRHFLVVEETRSDVGLHLAERRAAQKPKATVVRSVLRLVDDSSRVLWERPTEDKTLVGDRADPQHLQISPGGAVALLLQDVDPYSKNRPILSVIDSRGREALRLDYTSWSRVDEFALSADGRALAVHGFGIVPEDAEISRAIGYYRLGKGPLWIKALPRDPSPRLRLEIVDVDGWTCCVDTPQGWAAYSHGGSSKILGVDEMWRQFGVKP